MTSVVKTDEDSRLDVRAMVRPSTINSPPGSLLPLELSVSNPSATCCNTRGSNRKAKVYSINTNRGGPFDITHNQTFGITNRMRFVFSLLSLLAVVSAGNVLMDASGGLRLKIPSVSTLQGVVTVIPSPGTASLFTSADDVLSLESEEPACLTCRGATLSGTSIVEGSALSTSSLVSGAILIDGITQGDVEAGWSNSRHARTVTALFRARLALKSMSKQSLILCIKGEVDDATESSLKGEARALFDATAAETKVNVSFRDMYDIDVVSVVSEADATEVRVQSVVKA